MRAAVKNCGVKFPVSRITVNLAPAGRKKEGTLYDLPILLGILACAEEIKPPAKDAAFVGELSLTGTLRAVNGVLPMAMAAVRAGIRTLYVPAANAAEATLADGVTVYGDFTHERTAVVALNIADLDSGEVADALAEDYGIATRSGAHCAPRLHRALGTEGQGAVRFSFGWYNTEEETDAAIRAVEELAR